MGSGLVSLGIYKEKKMLPICHKNNLVGGRMINSYKIKHCLI